MYTQTYSSVMVARDETNLLIKALSDFLMYHTYIICELGISEELSRLQIQSHKHPTCRPLRWHMQHLGLPTSTAYRIRGDHKIYRIALEANGSVIQGYDTKNSWLTPASVVTQFPTPFSFGSLEATQAIHSRHNSSSRHCQQRGSSPQSRFGRQSA